MAGPLALALLLPPDRAGHYPNAFGAVVAGILLGAGLGSIFEGRYVRFRVQGSLGRRALRYLLGVGLIGLIYAGGGRLPELEPWALEQALRLLRYALIGFVAVGLAPWLFVRLRLAASELDAL
jgi:hypothetical protein